MLSIVLSLILSLLEMFGNPICLGTLLLGLAVAGSLAWRWRRTSPRRCIGLAVLTVLFVAAVVFLWPKPAGRYCSWQCDPWGATEYFDCDCIGHKSGDIGADASRSICYGIPYRCVDLEVYTPPPAIATPMPTATLTATNSAGVSSSASVEIEVGECP